MSSDEETGSYPASESSLPWTVPIRWKARCLSRAPKDRPTNALYPLYLDILNECFPQNDHSIVPQYITPSGAHTISFVVENLTLDSEPLLIVDVRPQEHMESMATRKEADKRMRAWLEDMAHLVPCMKKLRGVSIMGTHVAYYSLDMRFPPKKGIVTPKYVPDTEGAAKDTVPLRRWVKNGDIMSEGGCSDFRSMVQEIEADLDEAVQSGSEGGF